MNIRRRGSRATLWRTEWVPKGREGNSHGFKRERFIASIPCDAREIPDALEELLTPAELAVVHKRVVEPARAAWLQQEKSRAASKRGLKAAFPSRPGLSTIR